MLPYAIGAKGAKGAKGARVLKVLQVLRVLRVLRGAQASTAAPYTSAVFVGNAGSTQAGRSVCSDVNTS
jgi:hypothetical protein